MGILRTFEGSPDETANITPVDIVADVIIAAPWYRQNIRQGKGERDAAKESDLGWVDPQNPVINTELTYVNSPPTWGFLCSYVGVVFRKYPLDRAMRYPALKMVHNRYAVKLRTFFQHRAFQKIVDGSLRIIGKKPQ